MGSKRRRTATQIHRRKWFGPALALTVIILAAILIKWQQIGAQAEPNDPNVVVNLTSRVGKQAPSFTLTNSEGRRYTIAPGDGRKYILIFHMGSI